MLLTLLSLPASFIFLTSCSLTQTAHTHDQGCGKQADYLFCTRIRFSTAYVK